MSKRVQYNRIKGVLADKQKSNKDLADALQVTEQTVSRWCTNASQPSIEALFEIADALNVDVKELLVSSKG
jgi:transcriptional regulator with XRE-family HTH domain